MATYVTRKCPHCGYAYQVFEAGEQRKYGCPLMRCSQCQKQFFDTETKEPALYGFSNAYEIKQRIRRIVTFLFVLPISLAAIWSGVELIFDKEFWGIGLILFGAFWLFLLLYYLKTIIENIENKENVVLEQQQEYDESLKRLKDSDYLGALAHFDLRAEKVLRQRVNRQPESYAKRPDMHPKTLDEYFDFLDKESIFMDKRNVRIKEYAEKMGLQTENGELRL